MMRKEITAMSVGIILLVSSAADFAQSAGEIRYVSLGDSYTIGTGASAKRTWPILLAEHLRFKGFNIRLVANPAHNGFTTRNVMIHELPILRRARPNFVTLMIGVNDYVQGVSEEQFRSDFKQLVDAVLKALGDKGKLLVVNIPDFSFTPGAKGLFPDDRDIAGGITQFNQVIYEESSARGLDVVNIFPVSQAMKKDASLIAPDGLHPSAKGYLLFEQAIFPKAKILLEQ